MFHARDLAAVFSSSFFIPDNRYLVGLHGVQSSGLAETAVLACLELTMVWLYLSSPIQFDTTNRQAWARAQLPYLPIHPSGIKRTDQISNGTDSQEKPGRTKRCIQPGTTSSVSHTFSARKPRDAPFRFVQGALRSSK